MRKGKRGMIALIILSFLLGIVLGFTLSRLFEKQINFEPSQVEPCDYPTHIWGGLLENAPYCGDEMCGNNNGRRDKGDANCDDQDGDGCFDSCSDNPFIY